MKKTIIAFMALISIHAHAARYMTKTGSVKFVSKAPMETIEGNNKSVAALLDSQNGTLDFVILVKSFVFDKQLMQEHFNENYMESEKYPKATFKGSIVNPASVNFDKDGNYKTQVSGKMTIHGVTRDVQAAGVITVRGSEIQLQSEFSLQLSDYNISIPGAVKDKISKDVKIVVNCRLDKMK